MFKNDDFCERIVAEMQKTTLMDSETIVRKELLGLVQSDRQLLHHPSVRLRLELEV